MENNIPITTVGYTPTEYLNLKHLKSSLDRLKDVINIPFGTPVDNDISVALFTVLNLTEQLNNIGAFDIKIPCMTKISTRSWNPTLVFINGEKVEFLKVDCIDTVVNAVYKHLEKVFTLNTKPNVYFNKVTDNLMSVSVEHLGVVGHIDFLITPTPKVDTNLFII